jgi:hypothetical protein
MSEDRSVEQETEDGTEVVDTPKVNHKKKPSRFRKKGKGTTPQMAAPAFKGEITSLKDEVFIHSQIHTKKWITARQKFINYASKSYGGNEETSLELKKLTVVTVEAPIQPTTAQLATMDNLEKEFAKDDFRQDKKTYKDVIQKTKNNLTKLYKPLWGQCDPIMKNKIKAMAEYQETHTTKSVIGLLSIIEMVCEQGDTSRNRRVQRFLSKKKVYNYRQTDEMDLGEYLEKFEALVRVAEKNGALFYEIEDLEEANGSPTTGGTNDDVELKSEDVKKERLHKAARDRALAMIFFMNSNEKKYAVYKQDCHNAMAKGRDEYPTTIIDAHTELEDFKFNPRLYQVKDNNTYQRTKFAGHQFLIETETEDTPKYDRTKWRPKGNYECHNCDRKNQCIASDCTHKTKENGDPTRDERRRVYNERKETIEGDTHLMEAHEVEHEGNGTSSDIESDDNDWASVLEGDDYDTNFYMNGNEIVIEDLRGKNKHAFNQCKRKLNPRWILLDNCSSVNVFYNKRFLKNIREASTVLHLYTNAGKAIITMVGDLPGFGEVYYYPEGIANILSFHTVTNMPGYIVEYNNGIEDAFRVTNKRGDTRKFIPSPKGLYYWDSSEAISQTHNTFLETAIEEIAVSTIKGNRAKYSQRDNSRADQARALQNITNWSQRDMMRASKYGAMLNNPFSPRDITMMKVILGAHVAGLKGKTVRRRRSEVSTDLVPVPRQVMNHYNQLIISMDIMHVNGVPFLTTICKHIHYGTATPIPDMSAETMLGSIMALDKFYKKRGFKIDLILADKQFECLDNELGEAQMLLNIAAQDEHVPEIERFIRVIKERARSAFNNTPFTKVPKRYTLFYINGLPWERGVSLILSPMTIITGRKLDYRLHCTVPFGTYVQVRRGTDNTMRYRTFGAIVMGPMANIQGGMIFMSLRSGRKVERDNPDYTVLPMPDEVIDRVNRMGKDNPGGLIFTNRDNEEIIELLDDEHSEIDNNEDNESVNSNDDHTIESTGVDDHSTDEEGSTGVDSQEDNNDIDLDNDSVDDENEEEIIEFEYPEDEGSESSNEEEPNPEDDSDQENTDLGVRSGGRNIQPYVWPGYEDAYTNLTTDGDLRQKYRHFTVQDLRGQQNPSVFSHQQKKKEKLEYQYYQGIYGDDVADTYTNLEVVRSGNEQHNYEKAMNFLNQASERCQEVVGHYAMTQYGLNAGLKHFGEEGHMAKAKEMKQMLSREVFEEIQYSTLSNEDKKLALPILLFLTRKRDGSVKGRACADGRKQRIWMDKEDTRSPTVATEALFYLLMIDAYEERDVATLDLPGHFLQTPMEGRLILRLDRELALALVDINQERWGKHLQKIRGRWVIFVKCSKAIYGTLNAALLSYKKLIGHLGDWGFVMNPYDPCVWNRMIDGKQMTVAFHVDDMKISHKDPKHVNDVIERLRKIYGKTDPMTVNRGKEHDYLGMSIDFRTKGAVKITMYDYVQRMINDLKADMIGGKPTAAPHGLFHTANKRDNIPLLGDEQKDYFHTMTARTLYLGKRARPDLQTAVAFLCTRVRNPDANDYQKLVHLMKYLQSTKHLPMILRYDGKEISLYIDGAHAVHSDMKGHVGMMVTGGVGTIFASSTKAKLNTTSSTETEVVAVGERLPKHIWFRYFRLAQGGDNREDVLYQDNQAAMLLQNNGRMSCGKGSKHIHIRYFFITDKINSKEIRVQHCPTKEMIADYFTKPVQGGLFRKFRDMILGIKQSDNQHYKHEYNKAIDQYGLNTVAAATA